MAVGTEHTLSFRYRYLENDLTPTGIRAFNLPGSGYSSYETDQTGQVVDTVVLGPTAVNETHFMFDRTGESYKTQSDAPQVNVVNSFVSGGSGRGSSFDIENYYELQNYTTLTHGAHTTKFGIRIRASDINDFSNKNFNGIYAFLGRRGIRMDQWTPYSTCASTSLQQYQLTEMLLAQGSQIRLQIESQGGGPSRFTIIAGNPSLKFSQLDFGPFVQDDWKIAPNFTLSLGIALGNADQHLRLQ